MDYEELNRLRLALEYFAERCNFAFKPESITPPEGAKIFEGDKKRYFCQGSFRLISKHKGSVLYFDGNNWTKVPRNTVKKVALC